MIKNRKITKKKQQKAQKIEKKDLKTGMGGPR